MATPDPAIEKLYECAQILSDAKGNIGERTNDYKTILNGVKGSSQAKRLASQFIARFFSKFPSLGNEALDAILDLCEDDDVNIRKQAIKDLPLLCREKKEYLPKIADVLSQLLPTDEPSELTIIQNSLMSVFRKDSKGTLIGLFSQIKTGGDLVREKVLSFLFVKIKAEGKDLLKKESEVHLFEEIKTCAFEGCSSEEFHTFMKILAMTSIPKTVTGQSMIVEMVSKVIDFEKEFKVDDEEGLDRLIQCCRVALPYFSSQVKSTKFVEYLCLRVLPDWESILSPDQAQLLKILAEMCMFTSNFDDPMKGTEVVYQTLMEYLPIPPENTDVEQDMTTIASQFEFTKVECLLFTFHTVAQMAPQFLTENPTTLKEFKSRLQYFALGIQGYIRKLREHLTGKTAAELKSDENQLKAVALKSATNINSLIKDLFHTPPSYKTKIVVSWRPRTPEKPAVKRSSISFDATASQEDQSRKKYAKTPLKAHGNHPKGVYAPPQGKYSEGVGNFSDRLGKRGQRNGRARKFRGGRRSF